MGSERCGRDSGGQVVCVGGAQIRGSPSPGPAAKRRDSLRGGKKGRLRVSRGSKKYTPTPNKRVEGG